MADVEIDFVNGNPEELANKGIRAYHRNDYGNAVTALSYASEQLAKEKGEKDESLGRIYLYYGKSLLEFSREETQPLGDQVPRKLPTSDDSDDENNVSIPEIDKTKQETKVEEKNPENSNGDTPGPSVQQPEEDPSDLQVAWEVLELAKIIFETKGDQGKEQLAETLITLGEVSMESENFDDAVNDISKGLEMFKTLYESDSRILAETYYKLAIALSTAGKIDDAITNFNISLDTLKKRLQLLNKPKDDEEIKDIEGLIPEIEEKIIDMNSVKEEKSNELLQAVNSKLNSASIETKTSNGVSVSSTDKEVNDISHLVKRKRKSDEDENKEFKKPNTD